MEARFINGTTVTRIWSDETTELLGAFQYENDALAFAKLKAKDETRPVTVRYVVYCHLTAKTTIVAPPPNRSRDDEC